MLPSSGNIAELQTEEYPMCTDPSGQIWRTVDDLRGNVLYRRLLGE